MIKVLVVDDSIVFRTQISSSLKGVDGIEVVGSAPNGKIAIQKLGQMNVDLITLDMEMPEMGGLETIKQMRAMGFNTKIIVFSSQTKRGAEMALEALRLGANDVVAKPSGEDVNFDNAQVMIAESLIPRVLQFLQKPQKDFSIRIPDQPIQKVPTEQKRMKKSLVGFFPEAVVIASSTGGPNALETIFNHIKGPIKLPVIIAQHMPPVFTQILAKRIGEMTGVESREAIDGEVIKANTIYVAPGGKHLLLKKQDNKIVAELNELPMRNSVRPAADYLFETASDIYGSKLLGLVLTGMGEDGAEGAKKIYKNNGRILIQDKDSCVVFGMPGAVFQNDDFDEIKNLNEIGSYLKMVLS